MGLIERPSPSIPMNVHNVIGSIINSCHAIITIPKKLQWRMCVVLMIFITILRSQQSTRKVTQEPPSTGSSGGSSRPRPPLPPGAKKRTGRGGASGGHDGKKERGTTSHDGATGDQDQHDIDYRTATPQEVLE